MTITNLQPDKSSPTPIYRQLSDALAIEISKMEYSAKLPTIRKIAQVLSINNTTVVNAYKDLEKKGVVYSLVGSGFYVARKRIPTPIISDCINFADTSTDIAYFPVDAFRQACDRVLVNYGGKAFGETHPCGHEPLREIISQHLGLENIQIITSVSHAIEKLAEKFISPGDAVMVERPGLQAIEAIFMAKKARIAEFSLDTIKKYKPKFIVLMPNFQIPTGLCYTKPFMEQILEVAQSINAFIIEIDSHNDFYYNSTPPAAMKFMDTNGRVIYIKSFSRLLSSGFKIGFISLPGDFDSIDGFDDIPSGFVQRVFDFYLRDGGFDEHAAFIRKKYSQRYEKLIKACQAYLTPFADFTVPDGGLGIWVSPKVALAEGEEHFEQFLNRQVVVSPGRLFTPSRACMSHFRINFANVPTSRIAEGIGQIASVLALIN